MHAFSALPLIIVGAMALPRPSVDPPGSCAVSQNYKVTSQSTYKDSPRQVSGYQCKSLPTESCSLTETATYTKTITQTISGGASFTLDLGDIVSAGLTAGYDYSWSTSKATGTGTTAPCPSGGVTCGLSVITTMIKTEGTVTQTESSPLCGSAPDTYNYTVEAPKTIPGAPPGQAAIMTFSPCLVACEGDSCNSADVKAMSKCTS